MMMKKIFLISILTLVAVALSAQNDEKYRRSSLYSILVSHPSTKYDKEIVDVFKTIPTPDKFDNHDLSVKVISSAERQESEPQISWFLEHNAVARRMAAKWFDRNKDTGECDMNLITRRGLYDADYFDVARSAISQRGVSILADAGEELIGNTFVLVNDIRYIDKSEGAKIAGGIIALLGALGGAVAGATTGNSAYADAGLLAGAAVGSIVASIEGFSVSVTSYLYRLVWNADVAGRFYSQYYMDSLSLNPERNNAFNADNSLFRLEYVGSQRVQSGKTSIQGVNTDTPEQMIRKVCTRSVDKSVVALQRNYDVFKVKTPIFGVEPLTAKIGLKDGVSDKSRYEVLERVLDNDGHTNYKRVGVIEPVSGKIWDNRFMAVEEQADGANLGFTTFRKVSGGQLRKGMLIREISAGR